MALAARLGFVKSGEIDGAEIYAGMPAEVLVLSAERTPLDIALTAIGKPLQRTKSGETDLVRMRQIDDHEARGWRDDRIARSSPK